MGLLDEVYSSETLLCKGLHEINERGELTGETLDMMGKIMDAAKDMYEIRMRAEYPDYSNGRRGYSRPHTYDGMYSGRRGMYSRGNDDMISMYEEKMNNAPTEVEREMYRRKIIEMGM